HHFALPAACALSQIAVIPAGGSSPSPKKGRFLSGEPIEWQRNCHCTVLYCSHSDRHCAPVFGGGCQPRLRVRFQGTIAALCQNRDRAKMGYLRNVSTIVLFTFTVSTLAQSPDITIQAPPPAPLVGPLLRPFHFERRVVSPARLSNSPRLESLVRGGNLYLSVQDVIALVLENNIDIAIQRYGPVLASEVLRRASGGGLLRRVGTAIFPGPASVSSVGVNVSAVGLAEAGSGVSSGGGIVVGYGASPPNLDPFLFASANFQHNTFPQSNTILNAVPTLLNDSKSYQLAYGQQFISGTTVQLAYGSYRSRVNSSSPVLNPYTAGFLDLFISQNLLQGFGLAVNNRYIRVAKNNMKVTDLQVKRQVITTVSAALN